MTSNATTSNATTSNAATTTAATTNAATTNVGPALTPAVEDSASPAATAAESSAPRRIRRVLIANRGEIACRVIATVQRMGLHAIAVYSDADADAPHVRLADTAVRIGPTPAAQSYLRIDAILDAARATRTDAVHPGYGFLSENAAFASALDEAGIAFIGPPSSAIATMGDKITARAAVAARDVPVVPGLSRPGLTDADIIAAAPEIGFPVLIKPSAGGGGKGMHRVDDPAALPAALATARREAAAAFGDDALFVEHFVDTPRHIEVQVLADTHGGVSPLGERECSLQRRHQKVIEEAPSALLDAQTRARIGAAACDAARSVGYTGAGTVEFIVSAKTPDTFYFMEMNTRLQVEHPVTEMVTGVDLVEQQIRVARGERLALAQDDITLTGHAMEARVYAEDPARGFLPTGGTVTAWRAAAESREVRVDAGITDGSVIGSDYDPMLAKVIAHGLDRDDALARLDAALADTHLLGVVANIDFCRSVLACPEVIRGDLDTELLDRFAAGYRQAQPPPVAFAVAALSRISLGRPDDLWGTAIGWRIGERAPVVTRLSADGVRHTVTARVHPETGSTGAPAVLTADVVVTADAEVAPEVAVAPDAVIDQAVEAADDEPADATTWTATVTFRRGPDASVTVSVDGLGQDWSVAEIDGVAWVAGPDGTWRIDRAHTLVDTTAEEHAGDITSPMPGTVVAVAATDGDPVEAGAPILVVEAMKMEHTLTAPIDGVLALSVGIGDKVAAQHLLAHIVQPTTTDPVAG